MAGSDELRELSEKARHIPSAPLYLATPDGRKAALARQEQERTGEDLKPTTFDLKVMTCPKCGAKGVAFICDKKGCPVNGGAAYPWTALATPPSRS